MKSDTELLLSENLVACPDCDLLQRLPPLPAGGKARCSRCRRILAVDRAHTIERTLALSVAASILFAVANLQSLISLSTRGRETNTTVFGSILEMWARGYEITAVVVGFCSIAAPALYIAFMLIVSFAALYPPVPWWVGILLHWVDRQQIWAMLEVMMLGLLISLIKLSDIATMTPGLGMYAMGGLIVILAAMKVTFDPETVWRRLQWLADTDPPVNPGRPDAVEEIGS